MVVLSIVKAGIEEFASVMDQGRGHSENNGTIGVIIGRKIHEATKEGHDRESGNLDVPINDQGMVVDQRPEGDRDREIGSNIVVMVGHRIEDMVDHQTRSVEGPTIPREATMNQIMSRFQIKTSNQT